MIKESEEFLDNVVIGVSSTFIIGSIALFSTLTQDYLLLRYLLVPSVVMLTIALFGSIWHRVRNPKRKILFEQSSAELAKQIESEIQDFSKNVLVKAAMPEMEAYLKSNKNVTSVQLEEQSVKLSQDMFEQYKPFIARYYKGYSSDFQNIREQYFDLPLDEKWARLKWLVDIFSKRYRIFVFTIGVIALISAIILRFI